MASKEFFIEVETKYLTGWIDNGVEYALAEIKIGNNEPELFLFWIE